MSTHGTRSMNSKQELAKLTIANAWIHCMANGMLENEDNNVSIAYSTDCSFVAYKTISLLVLFALKCPYI